MPNQNHREPSLDLATALDRQWDALLAGGADDPALAQLDPSLAGTTRRVHALDTSPSPNPIFTSTLWEDLMHAHAISPAPVSRSSQSTRARFPLASGRWTAPSRTSTSRLAAAILLIALLAGSAFAALYPLRQNQRAQLPLFAPLATPTAEPAPGAGTTLLDVSLAKFPAMRTQGGIDVTEYPPGGRSQERTRASTDLLYIAAGPLQVTATKAPHAIEVMQAGAAGRVTSSRFLIEGQEATLNTGTALLLMPQTVLDVMNDGAEPARMLDLISSTESDSSENYGATWRWGSIGMAQDVAPPVSVLLRQVTLEAGTTLPAPETSSATLGAAVLEGERARDVVFDVERNWHNASDAPIELYVLHLTSDADAATPAAVAEPGQLEFLWQSMGGPEPLSEPYGVGVDPEGNIWVADRHDRFTIIAPDGTFIETWGTSGSGEGEFEFMCSCGSVARGYGDVAFDAEGNIYVADTGNHRVQKFAPDRTFLLAWGSEGEEDGQFHNPSGIAIDDNGIIYVSDEVRGDIQTFDDEGQFLGTIGEQGMVEGKLFLPAGVGIGPEGDVWIADYGPDRIQRFSAKGEFLDAWGEPGSRDGEMHNPNDVAVDALGRVYVADDANHQLQVFTPDGRFIARIGGYGGEPGTFNDALGIAIGPGGAAYVAGRNGLQAFRLTP